MKKRTEIDNKYKISTKDLFKNNLEFNNELDNLNKISKDIIKYKGHLMDEPRNLYYTLDLDTNIGKRLEKIWVYAHLNNDFDLSEKESNELIGKARIFNKNYSSLSAFIVPELLKSSYSKINNFINEYPKLKEYELNLKEIFRLKKHILSEKEEIILTKISDIFRLPEDAHSKLLDADLKFKNIIDENGNSVELNTSNYATYIESKNRNVRINAFNNFYEGYKSVINTTSELLNTEIKKNNSLANIKHFSSALNDSLESNNVNPKVYNTLLESINNNLNIIHKEWQLRKELMGIDELHIYDTYVSLVKNYDITYTFEEGKNLVLKALNVLGPDYVKHLNEAFNNNWIDVYPSLNKRSGGYCTTVYLAHPYVFLNFDNRYGEVSTIAHELGHAMHFYYAAHNQSYQNYNYSIFVAEVASQVNELLLSYYMLDNAKSKDEKLFLLGELIKRFKASVVRQTMFAEFEKDIHEYSQNGNVITKDYLNDLYYELNKKYYGNSIVIDDDIKYEWSRIPHFYYDFYVYQYSTGYISALKIASDIYTGKQNALENYLKFLKLGSTMDPVSSLKVAGVDLTNKKIFNEAFKIFAENMNEFVKLYKGSE